MVRATACAVSFVFCIVVSVSFGANSPLMSSGYARTSFNGFRTSDTLTAPNFIPRSVSTLPENTSSYKRSRIVPTSFSDDRLPLTEGTSILGRSLSNDGTYSDEHSNTKDAPTGRALSDDFPSPSSAIARSFQDVMPSDINSLISPSSTANYDDDIQKSPLAAEYSYASNGPYHASMNSKSVYPSYGAHSLRNEVAASPGIQEDLNPTTIDKIAPAYLQTAQERYHPQRPYQAGYPADYFSSPATGTVSDVADITPAQPAPNDPMLNKYPPEHYHPVAMPYNPPGGYSPQGGYSPPGGYSPYPYSYNPPAPPEPPEEPSDTDDIDDDDDLDKGVYTHYNIGRKLYYAPLWFSLYFMGYMFVEICKHVWRHKYTFPVRVEDALGIGRSGKGDLPHNSTNLDHVATLVTQAIESTTTKYRTSKTD